MRLRRASNAFPASISGEPAIRSVEEFDESGYLLRHPEVADAVTAGMFQSGWDHYVRHGRAEGRVTGKPAETRSEKILAGLDTSRPGLEVGPFHSPITPKRDGYTVEILDYLDTDGLRAHYASHVDAGVDLTVIEEVDHVWRGEPLAEVVGGSARFDWVIASHVIEHIPDFVSFLRGVADILTADGRLSLVVPDKRYCFDHYSPLTTTGQMLDAYTEHRVRPTPGQVFDYLARCSQLDGAIAWAPGMAGQPGFHHDITMGANGWQSSIDGFDFGGEIHCWRFTPESFRLIITELGTIGLIDLDIVDARPTAGSEFFVTLGRGVASATEDERLELVRAAVDSDRFH